jgi:hypothetical protein
VREEETGEDLASVSHEERDQFMRALGETTKGDPEKLRILEWEKNIAPGPTPLTGTDLDVAKGGDFGSYDPEFNLPPSVNEPEVLQVQRLRGEDPESQAELDEEGESKRNQED